MTYKITIRCNNAAFDGNAGGEVARILREVAQRCEYQDEPANAVLRDDNGNTVGTAKRVGK